MSRIDATTAVLDALGIDYKGKAVTAVTIRLRPETPPTVHIVHHILNKHAISINARHQRFTLTPCDTAPAAFDIDTACQEALARVTQHIDARCSEFSHAIADDFAPSRSARYRNMSALEAYEEMEARSASIYKSVRGSA